MDIQHQTPSVGRVTKRLIAINPELTTMELVEIIRECAAPLGNLAGEFSQAQVIDEARAIEMARSRLKPKTNS